MFIQNTSIYLQVHTALTYNQDANIDILASREPQISINILLFLKLNILCFGMLRYVVW